MDTKENDLTAEIATTPAAEVTTSTATSSTPPDDAAHAGRRKRVEAHLKEITGISISSGETAPATATPAPAPAETAPTTSEVPATNDNGPAPATAVPAVGTLPADYLRDGYYQGEGKNRYPDPALVDDAEAIGRALAGCGITPTAFNRMVKTLKSAKKLPYEAQEGAMKKLLPQAIKEKKPLLREVVERNRAAVQNEADFSACLSHLQDMAIFLAAAAQTK